MRFNLIAIAGSSQKLTSRDLTSFCYHVAKGMEYLSSKKVEFSIIPGTTYF